MPNNLLRTFFPVLQSNFRQKNREMFMAVHPVILNTVKHIEHVCIGCLPSTETAFTVIPSMSLFPRFSIRANDILKEILHC